MSEKTAVEQQADLMFKIMNKFDNDQRDKIIHFSAFD